MRTPSVVLAAVLLAATAAAPGAAAPRQRTEEARYSEPTRGHPDVFQVCIQPGNRGCVEFGVGPKDRKVSIDVTDDTGTKPFIIVRQELEGAVRDRAFCGSTGGFIPIMPNGRITVFVSAATRTTHPTCAGVGTTGTVTATFTR